MKKVCLAAMLCMAIFTACSDNNSSELPENVPLRTTTAVTETTTAAATTTAATAAESKTFQAEHSVTFTPYDLDTVQLKEDFKIYEGSKSHYSKERDEYLSQLIESGSEIPVYVGSAAVDHESNCVYVIGIYDWCTIEEPYFGDVAVFRIDEATGDITRCCRKIISRLGWKNGFGLFNVRGKTFMHSTMGVYLVDEVNKEFVTLEPSFNPQVSNLYVSDERVIVQVPVMNEENNIYDQRITEFDFESNTMKEIELSEDDKKNMGSYYDYDAENINVECKYAIPENHYSKTEIKVEW